MRANNTSRSLQIISEANGWDATKIIGETYYHNEDRVNSGDSPPLAGTYDKACADQSQTEAPTPTNLTHRTTNANPFPDMPGSR